MDREKAMKAVKELLEAIGEDVEREGLADTPRRVADAFAEFVSGEGLTAKEPLSKTFTAEGGGIVVEKNIAFASTCEHHLMPFFGTVDIAYIPNGKVVGLSKLARCVEIYARRLQLQERMTRQIAEAIMEYLAPKGVMVRCTAEHTCMTCRGVRKNGTTTATLCVLGEFPDDMRSEAAELLK